MAGDLLLELLRRLQTEVTGVPPERWRAIEDALRAEYGGEEYYVGRRRKATLLARMESAAQADGELSAAQLADHLQVSVRHARRLKRLRGG